MISEFYVHKQIWYPLLHWFENNYIYIHAFNEQKMTIILLAFKNYNSHVALTNYALKTPGRYCSTLAKPLFFRLNVYLFI